MNRESQIKVLVLTDIGKFTINSFFVVKEVGKNALIIQKIKNMPLEFSGSYSGYETFDPGLIPTSEELFRVIKKVSPNGSIYYRGKCGYAKVQTLWVDDKPKYYFNHND